jgi:alcohol dehydrogenase class IV
MEDDPDGREGMALAQYVTAMAYSNVGLELLTPWHTHSAQSMTHRTALLAQ